jgi:hypothetical protein
MELPMTKPNARETPETPADPRSGEPGAGSPAPDVWPFEVPAEQRERITPEPVHGERGREGDVERPPHPD